jgi:hypothetical protein
MKKIVLGVVLATIGLTSFGQTKSEIELMQTIFGEEKMKVVTEYVQLSPEKKGPFMELYNEYEEKRKALGETRIALITEYAEIWEGMSIEQAEAWMKKVWDLSAKREKLLTTYYGKIKKATNAKVATQFFQVEGYILTQIRSAIYEAIPFVAEGE